MIVNNLLHVLDHSLPEYSGYAIRSHSILKQLVSSGVRVSALTSPKQSHGSAEEDRIDGVSYLRSAPGGDVNASGVWGQLRTVGITHRKIAEHCRSHSTRILHAHSPCLNGLAAMGHGVPLVYEMRSSWEDAAVSVGTTEEGSLRYRLSRFLETYVVKRADAVVVICEGLKHELTQRGVPETKVTVAPNALPDAMFKVPPNSEVEAIRRHLSLDGSRCIGFFGSLFEWEGVDLIVRALPRILTAIENAKLVIVGGGRQEVALRELVTELGLADQVTFVARVEHDEIPVLYRAMDVMAYPRWPSRLTNMVTPLKPLEAMAQETPVVASDVGGHKELIRDGVTGYLFRAGDLENLADTVIRVLSERVDVTQTVASARSFVADERRWTTIAPRYLALYEAVVRNRAVSRE